MNNAKKVALRGAVWSADRDYFMEHLSLEREDVMIYTERGDGMRKQNVRKNPHSSFNFTRTEASHGKQLGDRMGLQ